MCRISCACGCVQKVQDNQGGVLGKIFRPSGNGKRSPGLATQRAFGSVDSADSVPLQSTGGGDQQALKAGGEERRQRGFGKRPKTRGGRGKKGGEAAEAPAKEKAGLLGLFGRSR
jgi:hypothetical protein